MNADCLITIGILQGYLSSPKIVQLENVDTDIEFKVFALEVDKKNHKAMLSLHTSSAADAAVVANC